MDIVKNMDVEYSHEGFGMVDYVYCDRGSGGVDAACSVDCDYLPSLYVDCGSGNFDYDGWLNVVCS